MRRSGLLLKSPGDPVRAFWTGFATIATPVATLLTVKTALMFAGWSAWLGFLPYIAAFAVAGGLVGGLMFAIPVVIQGWAWRQIAADTPVADHDEGLGE